MQSQKKAIRTATKPNSKAKILVVDDHPIVREGLVSLLNRQPDMLCCGQASAINPAVEAATSLKPDLAIVDLRLGASDGMDLIKTLRAFHPGTRILVLSQLEQNSFAERALRAGAHGFVMKEQASEELLEAIRTVLAGEFYVSRGVAHTILRALAGGQDDPTRAGVKGLSDRELHILQLLGEGMTVHRIAEALNLSPKTVGTHRDNIKRKLNLESASALQRFALNWSRQAVSIPAPEP